MPLHAFLWRKDHGPAIRGIYPFSISRKFLCHNGGRWCRACTAFVLRFRVVAGGEVQNSKFKVQDSRRLPVAGFKVQSSRFKVQDSRLSPEARFKVQGDRRRRGSKFKVAVGKNLQLKGFSSLNFLHHATQKAVFCPATGDNADISHFFFFFIVCLNFKTAKLSSMDVSVSLVCKSSSRISAIISPLFRIRACCSRLSLTLERVLMLRDDLRILEKVSIIAKVA